MTAGGFGGTGQGGAVGAISGGGAGSLGAAGGGAGSYGVVGGGGAGSYGTAGGGGAGAFGAAGGFGGGNVGVIGSYGGNVCPFGDKELGMENKNIQDSQITSSTAWKNLPPENGRLNGESSWSAEQNDKNQWLQIDLGEILAITKIATQGRHNYDQWVTSYLLSYSSDGKTFENYKFDGTEKV